MLPSAGSALAAIASASPFATRRSRKPAAGAPLAPSTTATTVYAPSPGTDSCFGVRSLDGSSVWGEDGDVESGDADRGVDADEHENDQDPRSTSTSASASGSGSSESSDDDAMDAPAKVTAATVNTEAETEIANEIASTRTSASTTSTSTSPGTGTGTFMGTGSSTSTRTPNAALATASLPTLHSNFNEPTMHATRKDSDTSTTTVTADDDGATRRRLPASPLSPALLPPPPAPTRAAASSPSPQRRRADLSITPPLPVAHHALLDLLIDAPYVSSEPSSPASLASLPSAASMSSLSRMSSPADWDWRHPLAHSIATMDSSSDHDGSQHSLGSHSHTSHASGRSARGSAELVLPTLALPATSLHLGLERRNGPGSGVRIALIAGPERTRDILGVLAAHRECVQLPRGEVGVLALAPQRDLRESREPREAEIEATIITCLSAEQVRQRAADAYAALHALLVPSNSIAQQAAVEAMVVGYANTKDWVHLALLLDDAADDESDLDIVPSTTLEEAAAVADAAAAEANMNLGMSMHTDDDMPSASTSPPSSLAASSGLSRTPRSLSSRSLSEVPMQDTPRPIMESLGPWPTFDPNTVHSSMLSNASDGSNASHASDVSASISHEHEDPYDPVLGTVALLERLIDHPARVRASSTAAFFEWRPSPLPNLTTATPLTGPSTSPASSTFEGAGPMPTVARAQGGGEWEATLSRRLAHRRELDAAAAAASAVVPRGARRGRGARRRRSHSPPSKMPCPTPLFPRRPAAVSLGLADLLDAAFAPVRRVVRSPWNVVFACALAVAVGCGIWAVRAQGAAA